MTINIHPSAANNFNTKAEDLIRLIEEFPRQLTSKESFPSDLQVAATISTEDIIGDVEVATSDYRGDTITRYFGFNEKRLGLSCNHRPKNQPKSPVQKSASAW
jgi:hypothetical protein